MRVGTSELRVPRDFCTRSKSLVGSRSRSVIKYISTGGVVVSGLRAAAGPAACIKLVVDA